MRWLLCVLFVLPVTAQGQEKALVFAAASLKNALDETNAAFGAPVVASYAASSALARQIEAGAPAQVFISADVEWMDYLERKGLIRPDTRKNLLGNRLVWIQPRNQGPTTILSAREINPAELVTSLMGGRLALADPQHVPAGKYAKAALEKLGLWNSMSPRIAAAENVRAALALVARGEAPLGIVYQTDAAAEPKVSVAARIDPALHAPIVYPAAAVRGSGAGAVRYLEFLSSARASAVFERHGFDVGR
jgi:molybdate transport system substrate-binding protein